MLQRNLFFSTVVTGITVVVDTVPALSGGLANIKCSFYLAENESLETIAWLRDDVWLHTRNTKGEMQADATDNIHAEFSSKYGTEYTSDLTVANALAGVDDLSVYTCEIAVHDGNRGNMTVIERNTQQMTLYDPPSRPELTQLSVSDSGTGLYRCNINSLGYPANAQLAFEMTNTQDVQLVTKENNSADVELVLQPITSGHSLRCIVTHISDDLTNGPTADQITFHAPAVPNGAQRSQGADGGTRIVKINDPELKRLRDVKASVITVGDNMASEGVSLQIVGLKANVTTQTCAIALKGSVANTVPVAKIFWYNGGELVGIGNDKVMEIHKGQDAELVMVAKSPLGESSLVAVVYEECFPTPPATAIAGSHGVNGSINVIIIVIVVLAILVICIILFAFFKKRRDEEEKGEHVEGQISNRQDEESNSFTNEHSRDELNDSSQVN